MRYEPLNVFGPLVACLLALIATVGGILAPQGQELSWIAMFISSALLFAISVNSPKFTGKRYGDD